MARDDAARGVIPAAGAEPDLEYNLFVLVEIGYVVGDRLSGKSRRRDHGKRRAHIKFSLRNRHNKSPLISDGHILDFETAKCKDISQRR